MNLLYNNIVIAYFYFIICSFIGWLIESIFLTIRTKNVTNSGFLYGPFIPIYGFGALIIYLFCNIIEFIATPIQIIIYTLIITFLEYITSFVLEKILNIKLWDYSDERFNFQGRICLKFVFFWLLLIIFDVLFFQPVMFKLIKMINLQILLIIIIIYTIYVTIDIFFSSKLYFTFSMIFKSIQNNKSLKFNTFEEIKKGLNYFLKPINHFPDLNKEIQNKVSLFSKSFLKNIQNQIYNLFDVKGIDKNKDFHYTKDDYFINICSDIINHSKFKELNNFKQHKNNSRFDHSLRVAWISYTIGKKLNLKFKDIIKGALLHDFFLYDWRTEKPKSGKLHGFEHPKEAFDNSLKYFSPLTSIEKDIIIKHMWPLTVIPPKYLESIIVCIVDKIVATQEYF